MNEDDLLDLIKKDQSIMEILKSVKSLALPDWWVGGGVIRSKVWDHLHNYHTPTPVPDVDVVYFDPNDFSNEEIHSGSTKREKSLELSLRGMMPNVTWEVVNQARMHVFHDRGPYKDSTDAMKDWVETATGIGASLSPKGDLLLATPWGIEDLTNCILRPVSNDPKRLKEFERRIREKGWLTKWPKLKVIY